MRVFLFMDMKRINLAIQKSGRLNKDSLDLLRKCGIKIDNYKDQLKASSTNFPIEVYFLRNSDIPKYIDNGVVDMAIIGENLLIEKDFDINVLKSELMRGNFVDILNYMNNNMKEICTMKSTKRIVCTFPKCHTFDNPTF